MTGRTEPAELRAECDHPRLGIRAFPAESGIIRLWACDRCESLFSLLPSTSSCPFNVRVAAPGSELVCELPIGHPGSHRHRGAGGAIDWTWERFDA